MFTDGEIKEYLLGIHCGDGVNKEKLIICTKFCYKKYRNGSYISKYPGSLDLLDCPGFKFAFDEALEMVTNESEHPSNCVQQQYCHPQYPLQSDSYQQQHAELDQYSTRAHFPFQTRVHQRRQVENWRYSLSS